MLYTAAGHPDRGPSPGEVGLKGRAERLVQLAKVPPPSHSRMIPPAQLDWTAVALWTFMWSMAVIRRPRNWETSCVTISRA